MDQCVGFFQEAPGVRSMTRLVIFILAVLTIVVVGVITVYVLRPAPQAGVVAALAGVLAALVANGSVAIINRTRTHDDTPCDAARREVVK